jgi:molybdopterin-containing oxidoreductase family iron-sulfur binding subunit
MNPTELELAALGAPRREFWRSLAEAAGSKEFDDALHSEFLAPWHDGVSRRNFLRFAGASLALAGLAGCTREPVREIVPYVKQPEELIPGRPLHFATAICHNGFATGVIARSNEGHPTKIEGNPGHPASLGATNIFHQAALLDLYDPDRAKAVTNAGQPASLALFLTALNEAMGNPRSHGGAGLRVLTQSVTSPTLIAQLEELLRQFPQARWRQYQPIGRDNTLEGARLAFGRAIETRHRIDQARVILSLDADFMFEHPFHLAYARRFADGRRVTPEKPEMNRLYVVEPTPTITGSVADHRLPISSGEISAIAFALAREIGIQTEPATPLSANQQKWIAVVARDLQQNSGASIVIVGEEQPPVVHALAHLINEKLGNAGKTVEYTESAEPHWVDQKESLAELTADMKAGKVECLIILGGNPVFDAPADLEFHDALSNVKFRLHLSSHANETSALCHWHVPETHVLESWSDARSFDGTTTIIQPLIEPLYESKTAHELLDAVMRTRMNSDYEIVREYWQGQKLGDDFEKSWRQSLHAGFVAGMQLPVLNVKPQSSAPLAPPAALAKSGVEICFRPDPCIWDGRFANNGWLQELPKPFSKVTWDNPILVSPALAQRMGLANGTVVEIRQGGRKLSAPVWIMPGQAENSITVHLGLGRSHAGETGRNVGFNGYVLRASSSFWNGQGAELAIVGKGYELASMQHTHSVEGRDIVRETTLAQFASDSSVIQKNHEPPPARDETLYNPGEFKDTARAWGMTIDLNSCIGCSACMIACQAENNIPVVGKDQVARGRDMAWIRIDQYFRGGLENPKVANQPVPCMQCENAPCELVCPVGATLHDHEGLNLQVYNRCVGTRFCSNNCPYKVRRFNFYRYSDYETPSLKPMRNPNVTVRWRGVMEKCTYCIQRISVARIAAEIENRPIRDGEIQTACQQVCPTRAISFGNKNDPDAAVSKLKASPLNYSMLGELNTRPRTTYLARVRNPNPQMEELA